MEHLLFKATLAAAVLTFLIILFTRKENNYLSAAGGNTKKLMVVDQTTGAITFLNNSVQGINEQFTNSDATQAELLKTLFGPNLDGAGGIFKTKMDERLATAAATVASTYETKALADNRLASLEGSIGECVSTRRDNKFTLWSGNAEKVLADDQCDGSPGSNTTNQGASWCKEGTGGRSFKVFFTKGESYSGA